MILTSLLAVAFGAFGTNSNGGVLYHNTISFSSGACAVATLKNSSSYGAMSYEVRGTFDVDFYYVRDEEENTMDLAIKFNEGSMSLWTYPFNSDTPNSVSWTSTSSYFTNFEDSVLTDPNNKFNVSIYFNTQSTNSGTLSVFCNYYDHETDEIAGLTGSFVSPLLGSSSVARMDRAYDVQFDLDNLVRQIELRMVSEEGGYSAGYNVGYDTGYANGHDDGYNTGYSDGYTNGVSVDSTAFTIFNGILTIGMLPINVFLAMFDFTVFGINISNFVMSLLTVLVTIWVVKSITGGGKNESA